MTRRILSPIGRWITNRIIAPAVLLIDPECEECGTPLRKNGTCPEGCDHPDNRPPISGLTLFLALMVFGLAVVAILHVVTEH